MPAYHFERALFVVGDPNTGKSTQLRSMFRDVRLGSEGTIPTAHKLTEVYRLSNERCLYLRITSPHEAHETLEPQRPDDATNFLDKTEGKINLSLGRRWNFACPLQPNAHNHIPDAADTVRAFVARFNPERTRVVFFEPGQARLLSTGNAANRLSRPSTENSVGGGLFH
jgi:hypothetical protein